ncbi:MAG TPA: TIGR00730 family Rossman fold protein [Actinomycetota bacterium]|nr:TIGR00730 family Rossman fold protein [Actinomycetota bacterium]
MTSVVATASRRTVDSCDATGSVCICVFCGAAPGSSPCFVDAATTLGRLIANRGFGLVYGAGGIGMMGALANATADAGGRITGVVPAFLRQREAADRLPRQEIVTTDDLFDRKRDMLERSDVYVALPGGYGTLDEVVEVLSMTSLGVLAKPLVLVDVDGAWRPFLRAIDDMRRRGLAHGGTEGLFHVVSTVEQAMRLVDLLAPRGHRVETPGDAAVGVEVSIG